MRLLLVHAHPSPESFSARILRAAVDTLTAAGHTVRVLDLYAMRFDPVMGQEEWEHYLTDPDWNARLHADHLADLRWADGLILIYPTWWYGPPAMLKGWFERVWIPGMTFGLPKGRLGRITRKLDNLRLFVGITTSGSPWWWLRIIRDPGRSLFVRGMRPLMSPRCRINWLQLHDMNHVTETQRDRFLGRVTATLGKV